MTAPTELDERALDVDALLQPLDDIYTRDGFCDWADVANARDEIRRALSVLPASEAGWREAEPRAWLVEWIQDDEHWIDAHADECRAVDQARRMGGICTPLVPLPSAPDRRAGE